MITDTEARRIASSWYGGQWTGLYALSSSGAIVLDLDFTGRTLETFIDDNGDRVYTDDPGTIAEISAGAEIEQCLDTITGDEAASAGLYDLQTYITANGPRGPQPGWSQLTW